MGYSTSVIQKALSEPDNNQFKVAYQLVVDHKRLLQDCKSKEYTGTQFTLLTFSPTTTAENNNIQSFFATSPPPWNTSLEDRYKASKEDGGDGESSISVLSSSLPKSDAFMQGKIRLVKNGYHLEAKPFFYLFLAATRERSSSNASGRGGALPIAPIQGTPPPGAMAPSSISTLSNVPNNRQTTRQLPIDAPSQTKKPAKSKSRWHFGIRSKCPAWEVMLEIYRSLQNVGMEWRTMDPYHLRCRYKYENIGLIVKFDLQLYKLENNSYLVDFKNAGTQRTHHPVDPSASASSREDYPFKMLEHSLEKKMNVLQFTDKEEDASPYLARWRVEDDHSVEHVQSVYPFLDVCSKLITDIV